mgnify:CR=1 FL=1
MEDHKIKALKSMYKAQIIWAASELKNYLENPAAVGEHTMLETMDELVGKIAEAEDKLVVLETSFVETALKD